MLRRSLSRQGLLYRQLQILVNLSNECFSDLFFPAVFISHSIYNIIALFAVIELRDQTHLLEFAMYPCMLVFTLGFDVITMEYASRPIPLSRQVKHGWRKCLYDNRNPWMAKFAGSCSVLKVCTKPSLSIGRDRLDIFLRFCLKRTLFFVVYHRETRQIPFIGN